MASQPHSEHGMISIGLSAMKRVRATKASERIVLLGASAGLAGVSSNAHDGGRKRAVIAGKGAALRQGRIWASGSPALQLTTRLAGFTPNKSSDLLRIKNFMPLSFSTSPPALA